MVVRKISTFLLPLVVILAACAWASVYAVDRLMIGWFTDDLTIRGGLIERALEEPVRRSVEAANFESLQQRFERVSTDERLFAVGLCAEDGSLIAGSQKFEKRMGCQMSVLEPTTFVTDLPTGLYHIQIMPIPTTDTPRYGLVLIHDMSFASKRSTDTKLKIFAFFLLLGTLIATATLALFRLAFSQWARQIRSIISGTGGSDLAGVSRELLPVLSEFRSAMLQIADGSRFKDEARELWTPKRLRDLLNTRLAGEKVIILANREPYIHVRRGDKIEVQRPASGMVTALEPIMRACSGVWIAHGSGDADRDVVDNHDRVGVPPENPEYQLRRVWLTPQEETGYYFGFANEGLWPLCHIAHIRPIFRREDWETYKLVNQRFAQAVIDEAGCDDPIVLVQDYHFALAPRMIREVLPRATIITFWHIPWPNAEKFGICPWRAEILEGLLGSTIIGFHTRTHVNNFMDTVDREIESRLNREDFSISFKGRLSAVRNYPISIEFPPQKLQEVPTSAESRSRVLARHNLPPTTAIGVGIERLDYTKGILERFASIERLLEMMPEHIGNVCFIQIVAPSRWRIQAYSQFADEVRILAATINAKYTKDGVAPILLIEKHHEVPEVYEYYRAADFCVVSSLHDGMNLVAKEFVASRDDEQGVLILSVFAGASRELPEALIVNPYDIDECARAISQALSMDPTERRQRMRTMREQIKEWNVFRWAARMILDAAEIREKERLMRVIDSASPATRRAVKRVTESIS